MKILFEEYPYNIAVLSTLLSERYYLPINAKKAKIHYVGYYFDATLGESLMILPKVFLKRKDNIMQVFGQFSPEDLLYLTEKRTIQHAFKGDQANFIFSISTWLYLAIKQFQERNNKNEITEMATIGNIVSTIGERDTTELEIIKSLIQFNRENQQLFTFIQKFNASQAQKTNWNKTVNKKTAILQGNTPIYLETISKQKSINYDEELLLIFVSVLHQINEKYSLKIPINPLFTPIKGKEFKRIGNKGTAYLKQIKNKYFTDKLLKMWHLLYAYFAREEKVRTQKHFKEILLVRDFNIVFEDMIDVLLSDTDLKHLKTQKDGKELDHIYAYQDLLSTNDMIYHIGDSKYYKEETLMSNNAIHKQYTYAKNVIQYNIDVLNKRTIAPIRYRDELTEGYNVTPNFFISAVLDDTLDYRNDGLVFQKYFPQNRHFQNRLFDRDTLHIQTYHINFLYVLNSYITQNQVNINSFKANSKLNFRKKVIDYLQTYYLFYEVKPNEAIDTFIVQHFKKLAGKMYRPTGFNDKILIALEKNNTESQEIVNLLMSNATISVYPL